MAATNTSSSTAAGVESNATATLSADELTAKALHKRYEGLVMVKTKATKGKGAWYWAHLDPILVHSADTGSPKAVKLRCSLCEAVFSASNPSRTASEHLKRGTCPNFSNLLPSPNSKPPISNSLPSNTTTTSSSSPPPQIHRKRSGGSGRVVSVDAFASASASASAAAAAAALFPSSTPSSPQQASPLAIVGPSRFSVDFGQSHMVSPLGSQSQQHLILSGGKEDLGALAMLEDSVKRLKSPKDSCGPTLNREQIDSAFDFLADWVYECSGAVSFTCLEHPKFKAFLNQVGLPAVSRRDFSGSRLDAKYEEAKAESEAKIQDSMFFQIASDGWKCRRFCGSNNAEENLVNLAVNLPNGTSVYRRAALVRESVPSSYAEEVLWETIAEICGNNVQQCAGIVADKFKAKALRNLEAQHHWMVNLSCQYQGFYSLIKDFSRELPLFKNVIGNSFKLVNFVNNKPQAWSSFRKYQLQEYGHPGLLRVPSRGFEGSDFGPFYNMLEDILNSARALQLMVHDESFKVALMEDPAARDVEEMIQNPHFWNEMEAVFSLVKLIKTIVQDIETEKPRVGHCLPLWEELRMKVKDWCSKFQIAEGPVEKVIEKRLRKIYHPAWAAAFILDPLYLIRDSSGKYLPPFKCLTPEQEKDVDKLITRLVSREEAHIALMELMKWRTEGLDPVYAQAVQLTQRDPSTGKMKITNPQFSRLVWETYLTEFRSLKKVAVRLIFLHATACGFKCNRSLLKWVSANSHSRIGMDRAQKLVFIAAQSKLERRDFSNEEDKDAEFFALANGEDDVLNDVFVETSSM